MRARLRREISEREHIAKVEAELRQTVDAIPAFIGVLSTDGIIVYTNQTVRDYTGLTTEEVSRPDAPTRLYHPEDNKRLLDERRKALLGVAPFRQERRVLGQDGQYRWFLMEYNPSFDE